MKKFTKLFSALLLAVIIINIPFIGNMPTPETEIELCNNFEEDVFRE